MYMYARGRPKNKFNILIRLSNPVIISVVLSDCVRTQIKWENEQLKACYVYTGA